MCQFSTSQHFINHIQNKYPKYITYIIKHLHIKFIHSHNLSNLKIFIHARVYALSNSWEKINKSLTRSPFLSEFTG